MEDELNIVITGDMRNIGKELLERYKAAIAENRASGKLSDSAKVRVKMNGKYLEVIFTLQDYWKYIETGTKPHWPPVSAIEQWVRIKPIVPRPSKDGKIPSTKQMAYLISRKISKVGTKPTWALKGVVDSSDDLTKRMVDEIYKQIEQEVKIEIDNAYENIK